MTPAHQRLRADDAVAADFKLGLIVQQQPAVIQRMAQVRLAATVGTGPVELIRYAPDPAAAFAGLTVLQRRRLFEDVIGRCVVLPVGKGATELVRARAIEIEWR